ncbi:MAG TPA: hypothetical protein ENJ53_10645 [Phaeodactylibacter sp.]|nr:hypothetical protein [Phaeodactylibacter sp.]
MKKINILILAIAIISIASTCKKVIEAEPSKASSKPYQRPEPSEEITYRFTDRNDIPPPPDTPWWTIDTATLNPCESRMWKYLKEMYPLGNDNYWNYDIYALMEPYPTAAQINYFEDVSWGTKYVDSLIQRQDLYSLLYVCVFDTVQREMICNKQCDDLDSTFFLQAIGQPTLKSSNNETNNYFYYFKRRCRQGPCPYLFDKGAPSEHRNNGQHFIYGSLLKANFSKETGKLVGIAFYP